MGNITAYTRCGITLNVLLAMTQAPFRHCTLNRVSVAELDIVYWGCGVLKRFEMITVATKMKHFTAQYFKQTKCMQTSTVILSRAWCMRNESIQYKEHRVQI